MKKAIMNLVNSEGGDYRITHVSTLHRWTEDAIGNPVDRLTLEFDRINNKEYSGRYEISARDYDGIIAEIQCYTEQFFASVAETLNKNIHNGYRGI